MDWEDNAELLVVLTLGFCALLTVIVGVLIGVVS